MTHTPPRLGCRRADKQKKRESILFGTNGEGPSSRNTGERSHWGSCPAAFLLLLSNPLLCGLPPLPPPTETSGPSADPAVGLMRALTWLVSHRWYCVLGDGLFG